MNLCIVVRQRGFKNDLVPFRNNWTCGEENVQFLKSIETEEALAVVLRGKERSIVFIHVMGPENGNCPISHSARVKSVSASVNDRGFWVIEFEAHEVCGAEAPVNLPPVEGGYLYYYREEGRWWGVPAKPDLAKLSLALNGDAAFAVSPEQRRTDARGAARAGEDIQSLSVEKINKILDDYVCGGLTHAELDEKYFGEVRDTHRGWKSGEILRARGITGRDRGTGW